MWFLSVIGAVVLGLLLSIVIGLMVGAFIHVGQGREYEKPEVRR